MPETEASHVASTGVIADGDTLACLRCGERGRIVRTIGFDGRVVLIGCRWCRHTSLYQHAVCAECGAETGHTQTCSFADAAGEV